MKVLSLTVISSLILAATAAPAKGLDGFNTGGSAIPGLDAESIAKTLASPPAQDK